MTTATFHHIVPDSDTSKPWSKADCSDKSYRDQGYDWDVHDLRSRESEFTTDNSGFAVVHSPDREKLFATDEIVRQGHYAEVEALLRRQLTGAIKKVHIFDHTVRRRQADSPRQPVQQVRRHLPADEADALLRGRFAIVKAWRPIEHAAVDFPLAVVDWRTTSPQDFVAVDLMYPRRADFAADSDDRGKEKLPEPRTDRSVEGYEPRGEHIQVAPNQRHKFYFMKNMPPDEVLLLKCYDSFGEGEPGGVEGLAVRTPHRAFHDPNTPKDARYLRSEY
ncbi:hypothetical protein LQW54_011902 [Pestalotiopsis sp. IQ-011]